MAPATKHRFWIFTCNNYTAEDEKRLFDLKAAEYILYGHEVGPEKGTPHLQGMLWTTKAYTKQNLRKIMKNCWVARPGPEKALEYWQAYCTKDQTGIVQRGIMPSKEEVDEDLKDQPGQRTDLERFRDAVKSGETNIKILMDEHDTVFARCRQYCLDYIALWAPKPPAPKIELREWQKEILEIIEQPADRRTVHFYVDVVGGTGKSTFTEYLLSTREDVQIMIPAKAEDMAYNLDESKRVIMIDCPRGFDLQYLSYPFLESMKNGMVFAGKYQSRTKVFKEKPHVFVFCNTFPDMTKLSSDRYHIVELK